MASDWLLELGHTRLKLARRGLDGALDSIKAMTPERFSDWLDARPEAAVDDRFWLAAVPDGDGTQSVLRRLAAHDLACRRLLTGAVQLPVAAPYVGLGIDRWLAVQPVWRELGTAFCMVDCGSAITLDVVDDRGVHRGGWIAPGLETARAGLLTRAPVLDRPRCDEQVDLGPANDTAPAIERGLLLQQAGLVALAMRQARRLGGCANAALVLTGGDAARLQLQSDPGLAAARLEPDLVLRGLAMAVEFLQTDDSNLA